MAEAHDAYPLALFPLALAAAWSWSWLLWEVAVRAPWRARYAILDLLTDGQRWYGLDLVKRSGGRLSRGTVYVQLQWLEVAGLVASAPSGDEFGRRVYWATGRAPDIALEPAHERRRP